ncbi:hypothetical protein BaRGS_00009103, partial [Batillaria attramentaria]
MWIRIRLRSCNCPFGQGHILSLCHSFPCRLSVLKPRPHPQSPNGDSRSVVPFCSRHFQREAVLLLSEEQDHILFEVVNEAATVIKPEDHLDQTSASCMMALESASRRNFPQWLSLFSAVPEARSARGSVSSAQEFEVRSICDSGSRIQRRPTAITHVTISGLFSSASALDLLRLVATHDYARLEALSSSGEPKRPVPMGASNGSFVKINGRLLSRGLHTIFNTDGIEGQK